MDEGSAGDVVDERRRVLRLYVRRYRADSRAGRRTPFSAVISGSASGSAFGWEVVWLGGREMFRGVWKGLFEEVEVVDEIEVWED